MAARHKISQKSIAAFRAYWGREPDAADKKFHKEKARWPNTSELLFWDRFGHWPKRGELAPFVRERTARSERAKASAARAAATRYARELERHEKARAADKAKARRSDAARRGWLTRREAEKYAEQKRQFAERTERQKEEVARLGERDYLSPTFELHRYYTRLKISVANQSIDTIVELLTYLRDHGVKHFRWEREVGVLFARAELGRNVDYEMQKTVTGLLSTEWQSLKRSGNEKILRGDYRFALPGLLAMRNPGVDVVRYLVIDMSETKGLPAEQQAYLAGLPIFDRASLSEEYKSQLRQEENEDGNEEYEEDEEEDDEEDEGDAD